MGDLAGYAVDVMLQVPIYTIVLKTGPCVSYDSYARYIH